MFVVDTRGTLLLPSSTFIGECKRESFCERDETSGCACLFSAAALPAGPKSVSALEETSIVLFRRRSWSSVPELALKFSACDQLGAGSAGESKEGVPLAPSCASMLAAIICAALSAHVPRLGLFAGVLLVDPGCSGPFISLACACWCVSVTHLSKIGHS